MASSTFHIRLEAKVNEAIVHQSEALASGNLPDYPAYRAAAGIVEGLRVALKLADEVETEMNQ